MALEFREGHVVLEEILLSEMSGQLNIQNLEFVQSVKVVKADEEPLRNNFLNRHRTFR